MNGNENGNGNGHNFDKVYVVDTSVLIDYPPLVEELVAGNNLVLVPAIVHKELTGKKRDREADIGRDAREAIRRMNQLRAADHPLLKTNRFPNWEGIKTLKGVESLERNVPDDCIIAVGLTACKEYPGKETVLITHDQGMQLKARDMKDGKKQCLVIEECRKTRGAALEDLKAPELELPDGVSIRSHSLPIKDVPGSEKLPENGGAICIAQSPDGQPARKRSFVRKGTVLVAVPDGINLFGIKPKLIDGSEANLSQEIAMQLLRDRQIVYYSLIGEAGSGKTLLALALALELLDKGEIRHLYITRAPVAFGNDMGFLPGDAQEKMLPWVSGMMANIYKIAELNPAKAKKIRFWLNGDSGGTESDASAPAKAGKKAAKKSGVAEIPLSGNKRDRRKIEVVPYPYIRGNTLDNSLTLVDECQNMRPGEAKTFVTRLGMGSIMILTGDPTQVDAPYLTETNNGLAWFAKFILDEPLAASVYFTESVRSPGVRAVLRRLRESRH